MLMMMRNDFDPRESVKKYRSIVRSDCLNFSECILEREYSN